MPQESPSPLHPSAVRPVSPGRSGTWGPPLDGDTDDGSGDRGQTSRDRNEISSLRREAGEERFRSSRTWKVDCHEESIGRLDLHFLNPRTARGDEERVKAVVEEEDGESARTRESHGYSRTQSARRREVKGVR